MNFIQYKAYRNCRFKDFFSENGIPEWKCPHCKSGKLVLNNENLHYHETPKSIAEHDEECWEPDWMDYRYTAIFTCNNCNGQTYCCGKGYYTTWVSTDPEDPGYDEISFVPTFFEPTLNLFEIPKDCPESISSVLISSFSVAWADLSSAGNKLRITVEKLIDEIYPDYTGNLHDKIKKIEKIDPDRAKLLMSIKWLGNHASHDDKLEECDLAFAYQVIEYVLKDIYKIEKVSLFELAESVNISRGAPFKT